MERGAFGERGPAGDDRGLLDAGAQNGDVAHMPARGRIGGRVGVIDEIAVQRRLVAPADQPDRAALQSVDRRRIGLADPGGELGVLGLAQPLARRPQEAAAGGGVEIAAHVIAVADGDAAIVVAEISGKPTEYSSGAGCQIGCLLSVTPITA